MESEFGRRLDRIEAKLNLLLKGQNLVLAEEKAMSVELDNLAP